MPSLSPRGGFGGLTQGRRDSQVTLYVDDEEEVLQSSDQHRAGPSGGGRDDSGGGGSNYGRNIHNSSSHKASHKTYRSSPPSLASFATPAATAVAEPLWWGGQGGAFGSVGGVQMGRGVNGLGGGAAVTRKNASPPSAYSAAAAPSWTPSQSVEMTGGGKMRATRTTPLDTSVSLATHIHTLAAAAATNAHPVKGGGGQRGGSFGFGWLSFTASAHEVAFRKQYTAKGVFGEQGRQSKLTWYVCRRD